MKCDVKRWMGILSLAVFVHGPATADWEAQVEEAAFYAGDTHGTVVHDVYTDQANPADNFNGNGLKLRHGPSPSPGSDRRPGYLRFDGFEAQIPADAFVIEAYVQLTADAPSTADAGVPSWVVDHQGALHAAARRGTFDQATATWNTLTGRNNIQPEAGSEDQIWSHPFKTTLAAEDVIEMNITSAVRAWVDRARNGAHGYANDGLGLNLEIYGGDYPHGTVSFYDSETAATAKRPKLVVRYLRASSGFEAMLFQPAAADTSHLKAVTVEDAMIRVQDQNSGIPNLYDRNYGGQLGWYAPTDLDPSAMLYRWTNLELPEGKTLVEARLRLSGLGGWSQMRPDTASWQVRKVLRPWVQGVGTTGATSYEGVTWNHYDATGQNVGNAWQTAGGLGAADSETLFTLSYKTRDGEVLATDGSGDFTGLVQDWLDGAENNGIMVRATTQNRVDLYYANLGGIHRDAYLSPGVLVIMQEAAVCITPVFDPPAGLYPAAQNVEITTATAGASIRYTTDGSEPTSTHGTLYTAPVSITADTTLKAIAFKDDFGDSPVATAVYEINPDDWMAFIEEAAFYADDTHGTVVHDVYTDQANPADNFNGNGLKLRHGPSPSPGSDRRPGYLRFDGFEAQIPADAFVIEAYVQLTADAPSTADAGVPSWVVDHQGALHAAARRGTFDQATATWNTLTGRNNIQPEAGSEDQIWSHPFKTTLAAEDVVEMNITSAVRAWVDRARNGAHGYANDGLGLNLEIYGGDYHHGTVSFYDSETGETAKRPKLVVRYLRASSGFEAMLFQPAAADTSHLKAVTVEDAMIRVQDQNGGIPNLYDRNYGGQLGWYAPTDLDPSAMLYRWTNLELPEGKTLVEARLRLSGLGGWSQMRPDTASWQVRKLLRPWVQGVGTTGATSYEGVTWNHYHATEQNVGDAWQTAGGLGAADSETLFTLSYKTRDGEVLATDGGGDFTGLVQDWLDGAENNGIMVRATTQNRVDLYYANLGGIHRDAYLSPGILVIMRETPVVGTPAFDPPEGTYVGAQSVTITTGTPDATIRYTTDGSAPTPSHGTVYVAPVAIAQTTTLKAIAYRDDWTDSAVAVGVYTIQCETPAFDPAEGLYVGAQAVTITTGTPDAAIRYTTDGSEPTDSHGTVYAGPVAIDITTTLKAIAYKTGLADSAVRTGLYTIQCETPAFDPPAGAQVGPQSVTITTATPGATIHYTTDGSEPTDSHGTVYAGPVAIVEGTTLKAIAFKAGCEDSAVRTGEYTIQCDTPVFDPPAGLYPAAQSVTIGVTLPGAAIRYTTDGSEPTPSHGAVYATPVYLEVATTLKAIAYKAGCADSEVRTGVYSFDPDDWNAYLEETVFYAGDTHGTVVHDVYTAQAAPDTNFDTQGLALRHSVSSSPGNDRQPGYIRFDGFEAQLPADGFVIEAYLELTANAPSTIDAGAPSWMWNQHGALHVAARRGTFNEATATWNSLAGRNNIQPVAGAEDQIWSHPFAATLAAEDVIAVDITSAVRAWVDRARNGAHGYANDGLGMNLDILDGAYHHGTVSFYDSETAEASKRPRLVVKVLPASSGFEARLFQPVLADTSQIRAATVEDALIRVQDQNSGTPNLDVRNYGGQLGWYAPTSLDPSALLYRWTNLDIPEDKAVADARLRVSGLGGWSQTRPGTAGWQVRKVLRPWVEGTGTQASPSYENVTWNHYDATDLAWETPGALGPADSETLFNLSYRTRDGEVLATDGGGVFTDLVKAWLNGDANHGIMIRSTAETRVDLYYASVGGQHRDPYLSPGILIIYRDKLDQAITFDPLADQTYGDAAFELTASADSGLTVSYASSDPTVASVAGATVTILKAGVVTLTASQAGDADYYPADPVAQILTIHPKALTVVGAEAQNKVYDGNAVAQILGATLDGVVGADDVALADHTTGTFAQTEPGVGIPVSTAMTLTGADSANYTLTQPAGLAADIVPPETIIRFK